MGDREVRSASSPGLANVFELEERHARHEGVAAQPGEEGDVTFVGDEPGVLGAGEHRGRQVDKLASAPARRHGRAVTTKPPGRSMVLHPRKMVVNPPRRLSKLWWAKWS